MRSFRLALVLSLVGITACSFLLDTDALQKGTGGAAGSAGGTGGAGGTAGGGGTGGDVDGGGDAGTSCESDLDCQPVNTVDGCIRHQCGADKVCLPPSAYSGLAIASVSSTPEIVDTTDDIGYPSMIADGSDIVLAFWRRSGATTNVYIRRYDENPNISPTTGDFNAISSNRFESVSSSPGMIIRNLPRRIRLLGAVKPTGTTATGMYQVDVDIPSLRISAQQPARSDLGVTGYDVDPHVYPPRLLPGGLVEPFGMWMQQGKLYYLDNSGAAEVYSAKRVIGFAPVAANAGVHAALETTALASTTDQGQTELWTRNSNVLTSLIGDVPGTPRRGVATTATNDGTLPINFILWSFERAGVASLLYAVSSCDGTQCTAAGVPMDSGNTAAAVAPSASSARVLNTMNDRDLATIFQVTAPDKARPKVMNTAILAGFGRLTTTQDGGPGLASTPTNPASFFVTLTSAPAANIGPSSVVMTAGGTMMVAWVERGPAMAQLKTRRFQVKTCP